MKCDNLKSIIARRPTLETPCFFSMTKTYCLLQCYHSHHSYTPKSIIIHPQPHKLNLQREIFKSQQTLEVRQRHVLIMYLFVAHITSGRPMLDEASTQIRLNIDIIIPCISFQSQEPLGFKHYYILHNQIAFVATLHFTFQLLNRVF